jgi:hypothetical protein
VRGVPLGSFAELSCQKIAFDLQLADLPVQKINLRLAGRSLRRHAALEHARRPIKQLLLPVLDDQLEDRYLLANARASWLTAS